MAVLLNNVRLVARARTRGNDLFKSERYTEACSAYGEGLKLDPSNSVLYCNRAACWFKLGMWDRSIEDCNQALLIQPTYTKALLRRAASNSKVNCLNLQCCCADIFVIIRFRLFSLTPFWIDCSLKSGRRLLEIMRL